MFILVQFPFADLRPLVPGQLGRLTKPDWTADSPDESFIRGFGKLATRNAKDFGLLGERAFVDFNHAARLMETLQYHQPGWNVRLQVELRFRRLYFDGRSAGRIEYGFVIYDGDEEAVVVNAGKLTWLAGKVAADVENLRLVIQSVDSRRVETTISRCGRALGMAYVVATTQASQLGLSPPAEVYGRAVAVGPPLIYLRVSSGRDFERGRDVRQATTENDRFYITSAYDAPIRNNVLIQLSSTGTLNETAEERALRVVISHLNSFCFASDFLSIAGADLGVHRPITEGIKIMLDGFKQAEPTGPSDKTDGDFSRAIRMFALTFEGRVEEVAKKLQVLNNRLDKPSTLHVLAREAGARLWSLVQLATAVAVESGIRGPGS